MVEAFDTRLAAKEEVESLGAKFVMVEGANDDKAAGGYAVEQSDEYKKRQSELIQEKASKADVVIATAQLRGRRAPLLVTKETIANMKPGSVVVDLAASSGGNCELSRNNETYLHNGITIIGNSSLYSEMQDHASRLYAKNIFNFLKMFTGTEAEFTFDFENPILNSACIMYQGQDRFTK